MTTFHLIRHAERDAAADLLPGRAPGVRLTAEGRAQAGRIASALAPAALTHIYSSPLERAVETAAPLARIKGLPIETSAALNEIDFGEWTGKRVSELQMLPQWRHFNQFRSGTRIPGGEAAVEVQQRVVGELLRLRDAHPDQEIACFSHADPLRLALVHFLGAPMDFFDRLEMDVGSVTVLVLAEWGSRLVKLNQVPGT